MHCTLSSHLPAFHLLFFSCCFFLLKLHVSRLCGCVHPSVTHVISAGDGAGRGLHRVICSTFEPASVFSACHTSTRVHAHCRLVFVRVCTRCFALLLGLVRLCCRDEKKSRWVRMGHGVGEWTRNGGERRREHGKTLAWQNMFCIGAEELSWRVGGIGTTGPETTCGS